jgi:hypothetical protein
MIVGLFYAKILFSVSQAMNPKRILTTEVGVIRAMVPKVPFACGKIREMLRGSPCRDPLDPLRSCSHIQLSIGFTDKKQKQLVWKKACHVKAKPCILQLTSSLQGDKKQARMTQNLAGKWH